VTFKDLFSAGADLYARHRPTYPAALFEWLAAQAPGRERAWDCATGNGQAAVGLAERFGQVIATDASARQIANARPHPRVTYREAPAEASGLPPVSMDLVTVAQALHWLDRPRFYAEVRRVLRPGGLIAVWCYNLLEVTPGVDALVRHLYEDVVGPWWADDRALVDAGYRTVEFPFRELEVPPFTMAADWTLDDLEGYLRSWSAVQAYRAERGEDPVAALHPRLTGAWGVGARRPVRWPLQVRAGRPGPATAGAAGA
jgi:ubiquinone/menaquinone biosynthesis C-methylase UbiE